MPTGLQRPTLVKIPQDLMPQGAEMQRLLTEDKIALRAAYWTGAEQQRGTVLLFGGRSEYIEKYSELIADLKARGFSIATMDWRGQGGSQRLTDDPSKGHVGDFEEYQRDLRAFLHAVDLKKLPRPHIGLAHSMGGANLLQGLASGVHSIDAQVFSSPMVALHGIAGSFLAKLTVQGLSIFQSPDTYVIGGSAAPKETRQFDGNVLTSDPVRFARKLAYLDAGPEIALGSPTIGWVKASFAIMEKFEAPDFGKNIKIPLLFLVSGADTVANPEAAEALAKRLPTAQFVKIEGARHESYLERDVMRNAFLKGFDDFMSKQAPKK